MSISIKLPKLTGSKFERSIVCLPSVKDKSSMIDVGSSPLKFGAKGVATVKVPETFVAPVYEPAGMEASKTGARFPPVNEYTVTAEALLVSKRVKRQAAQ